MLFYTCCRRLSNRGAAHVPMAGQSFCVPSGALIVGGDAREVRTRQVAWFDMGTGGARASILMVREASHGVTYAAAPIHEPVVVYGPFVMNTRAEIICAFEEYHSRAFGSITACV